ncbi:pyridoxal phosphate-dependent aminotransferase [Chitinophaga japonensis]|uniref:Histidinol-phosphate aminotransferase n=1 Tax=Chitinophaga japonensis TaxID=104662 RepID=A0A562TG96_CHIJA|nr:histidinol-phosphate transaminase [Chitinophaga japonensis]TWI92076.1 histidinol-phosphate aminotransferase [Chitinophaga japonensis]
MNRRDWLRTSALFTGSLPFLAGAWNGVAAMSEHSLKGRAPRRLTDAEFGALAPRELKARLFANENPFGPSAKAKQAIMDSIASSYQYPFMHLKELEEKISAHEGLGKDMILLGAGSSPLLTAAGVCFGSSGGNVISGDPSYDDMPESAEKVGAQWIKVPLTADYKLDLDAMEAAVNADTKLVYVCNPNNPTATTVDTDRLRAFCERVSQKTTVFVDEAYIDYLPDPLAATMVDGVKKGQNIIVARTFSKLYGFAGLRVGYIIAQPALLEKIGKVTKGPWSISAPALGAAIASYQDTPYLQDALQKTSASKEYLYKVLKEEGYEYIPSAANFVMFPLKMDGARFVEEMMKRGVGVRNWEFNEKEWCRISIGRMDEMEAFATAFKEIS